MGGGGGSGAILKIRIINLGGKFKLILQILLHNPPKYCLYWAHCFQNAVSPRLFKERMTLTSG